MMGLARDNRLNEDYLKKYVEGNKPGDVWGRGKDRPVEGFYVWYGFIVG